MIREAIVVLMVVATSAHSLRAQTPASYRQGLTQPVRRTPPPAAYHIRTAGTSHWAEGAVIGGLAGVLVAGAIDIDAAMRDRTTSPLQVGGVLLVILAGAGVGALIGALSG